MASGRDVPALETLTQVLSLDGGHVEAWIHRGHLHQRAGRVAMAAADFERAVALAPDSISASNQYGNALLALGRPEAALAQYDRALARCADDCETLHNRAVALRSLGRFQEAARAFSQLLQVAPGFDYALGNLLQLRLDGCDWQEHDGLAARLATALGEGRRAAHPLTALLACDSSALQRRCAQSFLADQRLRLPAADARDRHLPGPAARTRDAHDPIRVAYLSADFGDHPLSYLLAGVLEQHDRARFEIIGVALSPAEGEAFEARVRSAFDRSVEISDCDDAEAVQRIRRCNADIAVDLMGYTRGMRLGVIASRLAPVQVNYLGYPGTMGADFIDYILADEFVIPPASRVHYAEQVVYLPDCFQANDDRRVIGATPTRAAVGLPATGFVWCCFNSTFKLNPLMFDLWCRLLHAVPGSVLWLVDPGTPARDLVRAEAGRRGIDGARVVLAPRVPYPQHLGRLGLADLFLDTLPFNAGATASDALWAGVPVLSCPGDAFAARMAGSLLRTIGLPELIAGSLQEYEQRAVELARAPLRLAQLRARLAVQRERSALFDTRRFCRHLEAAYEQMWQRAQRREPPTSFAVAPVP
jgi:predicted O-linked N-acetylglucosamine transferase (SPINDLY family)